MKLKSSGALAIAGAFLSLATAATAATITFENVALGGTAGPAGAWRGDNGATDLTIDGAHFYNNNTDYGGGSVYWSGFSFSNHTDTVTGTYLNDLSALPGSGAGGSAVYAIGYYSTYDPISTRIDLGGPINLAGLGMSVANTTYTALSLPVDDMFSDPFTDGDWLRLTITGFNGSTQTGSTEYYLADFRDGKTFILPDWTFVDLSNLQIADRIEFVVDSSDAGKPTYFAMDDFLAPVPEPSTALLSLGSLAVLLFRRRP